MIPNRLVIQLTIEYPCFLKATNRLQMNLKSFQHFLNCMGLILNLIEGHSTTMPKDGISGISGRRNSM